MSKLLEVKDLKTSFKTHIGDVQSVRGVSFHLEKGEALGVVGSSAIIKYGFNKIVIPIIILWSIPPLSSCY